MRVSRRGVRGKERGRRDYDGIVGDFCCGGEYTDSVCYAISADIRKRG
jgi:hypothetical protein